MPEDQKTPEQKQIELLEARVARLEGDFNRTLPGTPFTVIDRADSADAWAWALARPDVAPAQMLALHMPMTFSDWGGVYAGTGTFDTPVTGTKIFATRVGGSLIGVIAGYNAGTEQWRAGTDG